MPVNYNQIHKAIVEEMVKEFEDEFSEKQIKSVAADMIHYLESGAPYGDRLEDFFKWYKEKGGEFSGEAYRNQ